MARVKYLLIAVVAASAAALMLRQPDPEQAFARVVDTLAYRTIEGRLARVYPHKPYSRVDAAALPEATRAMARYRGILRDRSNAEARRLSGALLLHAGRTGGAYTIFVDLLRRESQASDVVGLIHASSNAALLTDFSAAALERGGARDLLLAYEAADRAWTLSQSVEAGWNRALAAQRIGMVAFAERAWREILARDPESDWAREAEARLAEAARRASARPPAALELLFYRDLFLRARARESLTGAVAGDRLASDTGAAVAALKSDVERRRLDAALASYLRGRDAVDRSDVALASQAYAEAERELAALRVPLSLIARDQRIRCDCVLQKPRCLETIREFGREIAAASRYPWLAARLVYAEGQTLYRQGRVYDAAQFLERALGEFERLGDATATAQMHSLLTNVYSAAGESDLALRHYLEAVAFPTNAEIVDRRRRILEDGIVFMLRHGYLATAELLLDELESAATTAAAGVQKATLRGVAAFRRGDPRRASRHFAEARVLLRALPDESTRADLAYRLAIAEAGTDMQPAASILADLDAGIAVQSSPEHSIWLPQLLTERGVTLESANDLARAEADYRRAMDVLESREPRIDQTVLALGLTAPRESPFDRAIRLFLGQGRVVDALQVAERASGLRISSLHARGAGVRDVFRAPRSGDAVAGARRALGLDEVAVVHHLLSDELISWVITRDAVRAVRQPVIRHELLRNAETLQSCDGRSCEASVAALSAALLHPWIDSVPRGATLLLQPAAELEAVPLALLETRERERLVLRNPSATIPKLQAIAAAAAHDSLRTGRVTAFFAASADAAGGLEALPRAIPEVTMASQRYRQATVDPRATRDAFLATAPGHSVVHFAGHVLIDPDRPLFSALVFAGGEHLYVHELDAHSFAKARLVVLSACESGRTPRPAMSVANALLNQNVPSVVFAFRAVDDEVAEAFAIEFHRALGAGASRAEAVRAAQLALMKKNPEDPTVWAAFAIAGAAGPLE